MADQPLIICPVCETRQPNAWFCVVCGKALHELSKHLPVATPTLEGLEVTDLDPARANVAVQVLEGLEATLHTPAPSLPGPLPAGEAPHGDESAMPDVEANRLSDVAAATPLGPVTCEVCGTPWTPGASRICEGCGMGLSIPKAYAGATPAAAPRRPEETRSCPSCGARAQTPGDRCRECGRFVPAGE